MNDALNAGKNLAILLPDDPAGVVAWLPAITSAQADGHHLDLIGPAWAADLFSAMPWSVISNVSWRRGLARLRSLPDVIAGGSTWQGGLACRWAGVPGCGPAWTWTHRVAVVSDPCMQAQLVVAAMTGAVLPTTSCTANAAAGEEDNANATSPVSPLVHLSDDHHAEASMALTAAGLRGAFTVLGPLATPLRRKRSTTWPGFPLLCRLLHDAGRAVVALPGSGNPDVIAAVLPQATVLRGLGAGAVAAVMSKALQVVSDDPALTWTGAAVGAAIIDVQFHSDQRPRGLAYRNLAQDRWPSAAAVWSALRSG